ncbi:MAG: sigma-70 family RNA polymerase sigma factor [Nitrospinota bacterium]|nr:sigma-70 family RNA polymerase sigma factor [Nitrospinota bacterium]MDH5757470.1 sigma-70 family RNA polymerase sigma factor [Nitrospinota bacterium]
MEKAEKGLNSSERDGEDRDTPLVERALAGDFAAFEQLVKKHQARVFYHAMKFLNRQEDAEDILQETFLHAFKGLSSFRGDALFLTWLLKIATNNCLMRLRKNKKMDLISLDKPVEINGSELPREIMDWSQNPSDQRMESETREYLDKAIARLPEDKRIVLLLKDVEGFSNQEISQTLGMSVAAVKSRLHRARLAMRDLLSHYFEEREINKK